MTRVCVRCGWLVLEGDRCTRDRGPTITGRTATKACRVSTLRGLLNLSPTERLVRFDQARELLRSRGRTPTVARGAER